MGELLPTIKEIAELLRAILASVERIESLLPEVGR